MANIIVDPKPEPTPDPNQGQSNSDKRAALTAQMDALNRAEAKTGGSGAIPNAPKQKLLDASDVQTKYPDKRLRWISVANADKVEVRQAQGYVRVPVAEGGRQVGNMALFALPRDEYERRVAEIRRVSKERLKAHETEVERMAEQVAKVLRDEHGLKVDARDIILKG